MHISSHHLRNSVPIYHEQVKEYDLKEAGSCVAVRAAKGTSTWIAFIGDSNQRQKIHSFLDFLPPDLTYSFYLGDTQVSGRRTCISCSPILYYHL